MGTGLEGGVYLWLHKGVSCNNGCCRVVDLVILGWYSSAESSYNQNPTELHGYDQVFMIAIDYSVANRI
jgi:hypothetical protein